MGISDMVLKYGVLRPLEMRNNATSVLQLCALYRVALVLTRMPSMLFSPPLSVAWSLRKVVTGVTTEIFEGTLNPDQPPLHSR